MKKDFYKIEFLSGGIFIVFTVIVCAMGLFYMRQTLSGLETPAAEQLLQGKWPLQFEKRFREALPVSKASRDLWGRAEYVVFQQGRRGVITGTQGWLFTDEEFSCPPQAQQNLSDNLAFIDSTQKILSVRNTRLAIVLIPEKARVLPEHLGANTLPPCRENLYTETSALLAKDGISFTDLLSAMQSSVMRQELYLKTDTHWSPAGAQLAARTVAKLIAGAFKNLDLPVSRFSSQAGSVKEHEGDLTSYIPGVSFPPDHITSYSSGVSVASTDTTQDLFGNTVPLVTLVGTSYSANPDWNFEGFLKESLNTDILNMADQGLGPFVVMDKYLHDASWKDAPPRLVVWEVPERYLLMPHGMAH